MREHETNFLAEVELYRIKGKNAKVINITFLVGNNRNNLSVGETTRVQ